MTADQRRIAVLERRIKFLRIDLICALAAGVGAFPIILAQFDPFNEAPVLALQAGILLALLMIMLVNWIREFTAHRRETSLREQDFLQSLPPANHQK